MCISVLTMVAQMHTIPATIISLSLLAMTNRKRKKNERKITFWYNSNFSKLNVSYLR